MRTHNAYTLGANPRWAPAGWGGAGVNSHEEVSGIEKNREKKLSMEYLGKEAKEVHVVSRVQKSGKRQNYCHNFACWLPLETRPDSPGEPAM